MPEKNGEIAAMITERNLLDSVGVDEASFDHTIVTRQW